MTARTHMDPAAWLATAAAIKRLDYTPDGLGADHGRDDVRVSDWAADHIATSRRRPPMEATAVSFDIEGAACAGAWSLFDSTDIRDHEQAKKRCATCPAFTACRQILRQETSSYPWGGSGPVGAWAGELLGSPRNNRKRAAA